MSSISQQCNKDGTVLAANTNSHSFTFIVSN